MQMQYLRAFHRHFADTEANPVSDVYGGRMVDMARAHVWAWDARPFPAFPANRDLWSDGDNYAKGHWLNGRSSSRWLGSVVAEICDRAGVSHYNVDGLEGVVRGYRIDDTDTGRSALQVLMLTYGFDALERDGVLTFRMRDGEEDAAIAPGRLVFPGDNRRSLELLRAPGAETVGTVRLSFVESEGDYDMRSSEAVFPDQNGLTVTQTELPLALTSGEGRQIAERWLAEARVARDTAIFTLPPSDGDLGPGDVVRIGAEDQALWRIDRVESGLAQEVEAIRVDPETYRPHDAANEDAPQKSFSPPVPVAATFLDLPLLTGDEVPHAPHVAMASAPWPGAVSLFSSAEDAGYSLNRSVPAPSIVGTTLTELAAAPTGRWDRGPALRVRLVSGALRTVSQIEILAGINAAAIGDGETDTWEVFQFADVELISPGVYDLRLRLRGQVGTDGVMPQSWPVGSRFVLLDGTPQQIELASSQRDLGRFYRYGPSQRPLDDPTYQTEELAFRGIGLRPYGVAHLRTSGALGSDVDLTWIRRTRVDGDNWTPPEVPLGEASERYQVRVLVDGVQKRTLQVSGSAWTYSAAMQVQDGSGAVVVEVAQVSDSFGPGPAAAIEVV